jgi:hypothetical protein
MAKRTDVLSITVAIYRDPVWGILKLGPGRFSINLYRLSLIVECWFTRGGLTYE